MSIVTSFKHKLIAMSIVEQC